MRNKDTIELFEEFKVLLLNNSNIPLGIYTLSKGGIATNEYIKITWLDSTPRMSYEFKINDRRMLVAFFLDGGFEESIIATYINFANTWKKLQQQSLEYVIIKEKLKFYSDGESKYIYFEYLDQPCVTCLFGNYSFALYDIFKNKIHVLTCNGKYNWDEDNTRLEYVDFDFEELLDYPYILKILESEASNSNIIIRN